MSTNSTTIPLAPNGTFTGEWEARTTNCFLDINVFADSNMSITVQQAALSRFIQNTQTFAYDATLDASGILFQVALVPEYFRVIATNTSAYTQTYNRVTSRLNNVNVDVGANAGPLVITGAVSVTNLQDASGITVVADISGQTLLVGNFAELVTDLSGQFVHVDNFPACPPVQMLGSLTQTNAVLYDGVVEAIISAISVTDGYLNISFEGPTAFTNGQSILLTQIDALPQLNGRVYQIFYQVGDGETIVISTPDLANVGLTASTGVVQSVRVTPLVCTDLGALKVDISGQDVRVNNLQDISGITVLTDISGQFVHVDNFPATQPVSGSVSLLAAADPTLCVGTMRMTDVYGQGLVTTAGNLMCAINNIYTINPLHTIVDSATGTTQAYTNIALSNTGLVVSAAAATIRQFSAQNSNAANQYIKIYNKATAATTADTPIFTFLLPTNSGVSFELNHLFSVGISVRATFLPAVADNTAAADYVFTNFTYSV